MRAGEGGFTGNSSIFASGGFPYLDNKIMKKLFVSSLAGGGGG